MKSLFFILLSIFLIPVAMAGSFSPSNLVYLLEPNKELCQSIHISSDLNITVFDAWAENKTIGWKVSLFNTTAEEHSLTLAYPQELPSEEEQVEVCISGSELGEYHGAIILRQEQQGTSIIQYAVWLKVIIEEIPDEQPPQPPQQQTSSSGGGGGGGGSSGSIALAIADNNQTNSSSEQNDNIELLSAEENIQENVQEPGITDGNSQNSFDEPKKLSTPLLIIPIVFIAALAVASVFVRKKRKTFKNEKI